MFISAGGKTVKYLLVVIGALVTVPHLSFAQSNSNATPPRQIYHSTDPINVNVPYRSPQPTSRSAPTSAGYGTVNSVQHYHTYWRTQQSASQRGSGSYANEHVTLRPLLQKLDEYNRTWGAVPADSPHHPWRTGQVQVKWMLEKQISDERNRLETEKKAQNKHLRDVVNQTDAFLNQAFLQSGDIKIAVRVQYALKLATEKREGNSLDLVTRDAEYYLHGLYASLSGDIEPVSYTHLTLPTIYSV